ncbi:hypothetical protein ACFPME_00220 [Rhodanobacter umsongensis]|uniref:Uncharacterized protein n=1 Tax=Rhodanobacter umsongensis TaxID=633153 RepID=A0ABW0JGM1_9GAMM
MGDRIGAVAGDLPSVGRRDAHVDRMQRRRGVGWGFHAATMQDGAARPLTEVKSPASPERIILIRGASLVAGPLAAGSVTATCAANVMAVGCLMTLAASRKKSD